jgi:hypothetical protein
VSALEDAGLSCLVMGGHAVRHYGLQRSTVDYDLHLAADAWDVLSESLGTLPIFAGQSIEEGTSWRKNAFRRFKIGVLDDGRDEWLEFWRTNHLLGPFCELYARRECAEYGGRVLPFMSLPDLIRSKETTRDFDWTDVKILEEFLDERFLAQLRRGNVTLAAALSQLRSLRGFDSYLRAGLLTDTASIQAALRVSKQSITQAFLLPYDPANTELPTPTVPIEPVVVAKLRCVEPASSLHLAIVEIVRRQYELACKAIDRADKEAIRAAQSK